jgi:hypothetical protein
MRPTDVLAAHRQSTELAKEVCRTSDDNAEYSRKFRDKWLGCLRNAETYYVADDMCTLLEASWESLPDSPLLDEKVPSLCGFILYEKPIEGAWINEEGEVTESPVYGHLWGINHSELAVFSLENFSLGESSRAFLPEDVVVARFDEPSRQTTRPLRATWAFMRQKLAETTVESVDRPERRRCAKLDLPQTVNVVRVRKYIQTKNDNPEQRDVEWSHRWLVSGHWRNQPCGTGREDRRPTWIPGHIKGPEDKPLIVKDRVTAWVR